jgi:hypothetical protein
MAKRSKLVLEERVFEILKDLLKENVYVELYINERPLGNAVRGLIIEGQKISSKTTEKLQNWGILKIVSDKLFLTEKGINMLKTREGLRLESKKGKEI